MRTEKAAVGEQLGIARMTGKCSATSTRSQQAKPCHRRMETAAGPSAINDIARSGKIAMQLEANSDRACCADAAPKPRPRGQWRAGRVPKAEELARHPGAVSRSPRARQQGLVLSGFV